MGAECGVDGRPSGRVMYPITGWIVISSHCHSVTSSACQLVSLSHRHIISSSHRHIVGLSARHLVSLSSRRLVSLSSRHLVSLSRQLVTSSKSDHSHPSTAHDLGTKTPPYLGTHLDPQYVPKTPSTGSPVRARNPGTGIQPAPVQGKKLSTGLYWAPPVRISYC